MKTKEIIAAYYSAFNRRDIESLLSLLSEDVVHDINQGKREEGKNSFRDFMGIMDAHYNEKAQDIVIMVSESGTRASAEFIIEGTYLKSQAGLPIAQNQKYRLQVGAFFELRNGKICRVSNHYNLQDWIAQVSK
jgi:steroid delta-isomerase-like uncharacterized protein